MVSCGGNNVKVSLLSITPDVEKHLEKCARTCYNSTGKMTADSHRDFLPKLIKAGHYSILSHAMATFYIEDISRVCSHQMVRAAFLRVLQRSQRYTAEEDPHFVWPPLTDEQHIDIVEDAEYVGTDGYRKLYWNNVKKEDARYVLPQSVSTSLVVSSSLQGWYDNIRLRLTKKAQWEIRKVYREIYNVLCAYCPNIFRKDLLEWQPEIKLDIRELKGRRVYSQKEMAEMDCPLPKEEE